MLQPDPCRGELFDERHHFDRRLAIGLELGDLRPNMDVDAVHGDMRQGRGALVQRQRVRERDAKLIVLETRGYVRMRLWIDVRIDAEADGSTLAVSASKPVEVLELAR